MLYCSISLVIGADGSRSLGEFFAEGFELALGARFVRGGPTSQQRVTIVDHGIVLVDEGRNFRAGFEVVERIDAAQHGVEGCVGVGAQGFDVERAGGDRLFETRLEAFVEGGVGGCEPGHGALQIRATDAHLGFGRVEIGEQVLDHGRFFGVVLRGRVGVAIEDVAQHLCRTRNVFVGVEQARVEQQREHAIGFVAGAVEFAQLARTLHLLRQIECLVFLGDGRFEGGEQRIELLDVGRFTHGQHVAGKLEVLHVLEPVFSDCLDFHTDK